MRLTHKTPETFLAAQIPPVLRKTGMALEYSIYLNNLRFVAHGKVLIPTNARSINAQTQQGKQ